MSRPRIIFWCGRAAESWAPPTLNATGLGGSETAVVHIARRFAADGWRVDVFNGPGKNEGIYDEVGYWEPHRLAPDTRADVLVSWRQPGGHALPVSARVRLAWLHDHTYGPDVRDDLARFDRVLGVSAYHAGVLSQAYGIAADYVPNGIEMDRFAAPVAKVPQRVVYASSPDRGLVTLLKLWPQIIGTETRPELHIAYGFDTMDRLIAAGRADLAAFKTEVMRLIEQTPQVVYRGRLPQDELARLYGESYAWLYPSDFLETSCISAMEAMAAGCVPVTSSMGALKETVGDGGLIVWGPNTTPSNPYSPAWRDFFVRCAQGVLFETNTRKMLELRARDRAQAFTWEASYRDHWRPLISGLLHGEAAGSGKEMVPA